MFRYYFCGYNRYLILSLSLYVFPLLVGCTSVSPNLDTEFLNITEDVQPISSDNSNDTLMIKKYMKTSANGSVQGASCYGDKVFHFLDQNSGVLIYDMSLKTQIAKITMTPNANNHCNNVSFSNRYYSLSDSFPLLYVSGSKNEAINNVQVYRIVYSEGQFEIFKVQEISLPKATDANKLFWTGAVLDNDNGYLYVYANHSTGAQIAKFKIPDPYEPNIILSDKEIINQFSLSPFIHQQGACIRNNKLFVFDGVPAWGDRNILRVIDLHSGMDLRYLYLSANGLVYEVEGAFFWKDNLYCITNDSNGIFKIWGKYIDI